MSGYNVRRGYLDVKVLAGAPAPVGSGHLPDHGRIVGPANQAGDPWCRPFLHRRSFSLPHPCWPCPRRRSHPPPRTPAGSSWSPCATASISTPASATPGGPRRTAADSCSPARRTASPATRSVGERLPLPRGRRLHLRLPGHPRPLRQRRAVLHEPAAPRPRRHRRAWTRAPTPTTRSSGCSRTCRTTTDGSACSACPIRAFSRRWPASTRIPR